MLEWTTWGRWVGVVVCGLAVGGHAARAQSAVSPPTPSEPPALRLQLLNGRTGRPIVHQKLLLLRKDGKPLDGAGRNGETTDGEGYVAIPNVDATMVPEMVVVVEEHRPCSKAGKREFALAAVRARGVVSENSCKPRITLYPVAGTLVYFVRDETFLERFRK